MTLVSTQPGIFPAGKGGRGVGLTILPPLCADCDEIRDLRPLGTVRTYPGIDLLFLCW